MVPNDDSASRPCVRRGGNREGLTWLTFFHFPLPGHTLLTAFPALLLRMFEFSASLLQIASLFAFSSYFKETIGMVKRFQGCTDILAFELFLRAIVSTEKLRQQFSLVVHY